MREITVSELSKILKEHERWCDTGKKEGEKADLSGANLSGADLRSDFLPRANLIAANLSDADLRGACLEDAVPLLVEVVRLTTPAKPEGQKAYQSLIELGFVDTPYLGARR